METRRRLLYSALATLAALLIIPCVAAQNQSAGQATGHGMGQGMNQNMGQGMGLYDSSSVVTVRGTVQDVQTGTMHQGQGPQTGNMGQMGTHLALKTDKETVTVLVGPTSFLQEKNFALGKGDQIEVTGSRVKYGGSDVIIAREIKKGSGVLTLRNEKGVPEWSMGRQR